MSSDLPGSAPPRKGLPKFVKVLLILIAVGVLGVGAAAGYLSTLPDEFRIERSMTMAAPPEVVFAQVNDFRNWEHWSPWAKLDPNAKNTFEGPETGPGAVFKWAGNNEVGEGAMTITETTPPERLKLRLDFEQPMKDTSDTEFTFKSEGDQTVVTWSMSGRYQNLFGKAFCKLMNMDQMLGDKFIEGLTSMKRIVETKS